MDPTTPLAGLPCIAPDPADWPQSGIVEFARDRPLSFARIYQQAKLLPQLDQPLVQYLAFHAATRAPIALLPLVLSRI